ncbi:hypothetical protein ACN47E_009988 [Coniothyrium glycines]
MARRSTTSAPAQDPQTPPTKRGQYHDLLAQFGPQRSSGSATKARRISGHSLAHAEEEARQAHARPVLVPSASRTSRSEADDSSASTLTSSSSSSSSSSTVTVQPPKPTGVRPRRSGRVQQQDSQSEDELAPSVHTARKASVKLQSHTEELKMEKRKTERAPAEGRRRSTRGRQSLILESDTMPSPTTAQRRAAPLTRKHDTARARLRGDIAHRTKIKANNFLVAHKHLFLPLLPENNQIAKLAKQGNAEPIVEYEELTEQPQGVTATMKPYQLSGLSFLVHLYNNGFSGVLGDEMGLGKTLQTLSLFQYLEEIDRKDGVKSEELRPYLVVCPLSVLDSWVSEAQRWVPQLRVLRFHGASSERARLKRVAVGMEDMKGNETSRAKSRKASRKAGQKLSKLSANDHTSDSFKIIVTTYDTFQAEQSWFKTSFVWRYVVLDEGHKIKSSVTQISTSLRNISSEYRLILTGTPLQNNLVEMWALLAWLYPEVFTDKTEALFKESFDLSKGKINKRTMDDARSLLELIMLRRMKESPSVNLGLPPKEEILLFVPLTPLQRFWYTRLLTRMDEGMLDELFADGKSKERMAKEQDVREDLLYRRVEELDSNGLLDGTPGKWEETTSIMHEVMTKEATNSENKGAWKKLMNLVMQLRKCCSHPYLLPGVAPDSYSLNDQVIRASGKFILLEKLLRHSVFEQGKKVLIFSGFTRTLDFCEDLISLVSNRGEKFRYLRLDGSSARARRNLDIRLFNQPESHYKVMLLSTRAGGLGINLTSAQDVIFLDEDWNPQITLQAEARAHRIGQTKKVTIYKLCTQGTVEEQMMSRIRKKLYLSAKITEAMQTVHGKQTATRSSGNGLSTTDDMPQMNATQLKTLVRRGAQTLSHPEIDAKEMLSWDLETMLAKCRDQPVVSASKEGKHDEADEDKWLAAMERVECAVFDGKRYQRQLDRDAKAATLAKNILPDDITRADRRKGKNTTVMVDGYAIDKQSMDCGDWEAVPTMAGKDPRLADPVREKRREFKHETHCLACFEEEKDVGHLVGCRSCPRAYHFDCLDPDYQVKVKGFSGFFCAQHHCSDCGKSTADAGGLIFRCRWCPQGFCEDCLDWDHTELIGDNLPEFERLGEGPANGGFYVKCPTCIEACEDGEEGKEWLQGTEKRYKELHDRWLQDRAETQYELDRQATTPEFKKYGTTEYTQMVLPILDPSPSKHRQVTTNHSDEGSGELPPVLTNTCLSTPVPAGSRVGTPKRSLCEEQFEETRKDKKARLHAQVITIE